MVEPNKAKMKAEAEQIIIDVQNSLGELKSSVESQQTIHPGRKMSLQALWEKFHGSILLTAKVCFEVTAPLP